MSRKRRSQQLSKLFMLVYPATAAERVLSLESAISALSAKTLTIVPTAKKSLTTPIPSLRSKKQVALQLSWSLFSMKKSPKLTLKPQMQASKTKENTIKDMATVTAEDTAGNTW